MNSSLKTAPLVGETVSHYRVLQAIGSGGMGIVYEAEDLRLGRHVALKFLPEDRRHPEALERFNREARAASALNHAHICTVYDIGLHNGHPFIVMERMEGRTLRSLMDNGPMPAERVMELGAQVADALHAAHRAGIVHRDLKPANIFVTQDGDAKLLDFGLAKLVDKELFESGGETRARDSDLTDPGHAMGTVSYMSPEQARGLELDGRADLFSLGVVLYEMTTGRRPFPGNTPAEVFNGILSAHPAPLSATNLTVPARLEEIVMRALEKDPALRYQSGADLRSELRRLLRQSGSDSQALSTGATTAAVPVQSLTGARRGWLALGLVAVTTIAYFGLMALRPSAVPAERISVLVGETTNRTDDPSFDQTVDELLSTALEQSKFLSVYPRVRVGYMLQLMKRAPDTAIDETVGIEICQREGLGALATSSVSRLGETYVLLVSIKGPDGRNLATARETFKDPADLPTRIDASVAALRGALGESAASIREHSAPLADVMSGSLEAVKFYTAGRQRLYASDPAGAVVMFEKALELDPEFAMAYEYMGVAYQNQNNYGKALDHVQRAVALVDRVPEAERHKILADYNMLVENWAEACPHLEVLVQLRPLDPTSLLGLGLCKSYQYEFAGALADTGRALALQPTPKARVNMARMEFLSGNARGALDRANALRVELPSSQQAHFVAGQSEMALGLLDEAVETSDTMVALGGNAEVQGRLALADIALTRGDVPLARAAFATAFQVANRQGNALEAGRAAVVLAETALASSDQTEVSQQIERLKSLHHPALAFLLNRTLLRAGRLSEVGDLSRSGTPTETASQRSLRAILRSEQALARKDWPAAIRSADEAWVFDPSVLAREAQARSRAAASMNKEAVAFFEDVLKRTTERIDATDSPGLHRVQIVRLRLGILLDDLGEKARAKPHLEAFLKLVGPAGLGSAHAIEAGRRLKGL